MVRPNPIEEVYFSEDGGSCFVPTCQARTLKKAIELARNYDFEFWPNEDIWGKRKVKIYNGEVGDESVYAGELMCWTLGE
ncbi:MAG: hypothetical protein WC891_02855 [Actinomycetota bacterium]